jgi:hypothetical protein
LLACDVPEHRLKRGDIFKLVDHQVPPDGTEGFSIEVFNAVVGSITVTAVQPSPSNRSAKTKSSVHVR